MSCALLTFGNVVSKENFGDVVSMDAFVNTYNRRTKNPISFLLPMDRRNFV